MATLFRSLWRDRRGQDLIEYAMMGGFLAIAAAASVPQLGEPIANLFARIGTVLSSINPLGA